jgi:hypothetical protein
VTRRRRRRATVFAGIAGVATAALVGVTVLRFDPGSIVTPAEPPVVIPSCVASTPLGRLRLDPGQAEDATTIAAVGQRDGLPERAVTVALAAALQESKLRNLTSGDLDSVGVFQQRPSQGWGPPDQLLVPSVAAAGFYGALVRVPHWDAMAVGDAAQAVQRSAAPGAYRQWEHQAEILTAALTGGTAAAFSCRFPPAPAGAVTPDPLPAAMDAELGPLALDAPVTEGRGWSVASWLIAHGARCNVTSVAFQGQMWTASSGTWEPHEPALPYVQIGRG